jgi:hypothetical protein
MRGDCLEPLANPFNDVGNRHSTSDNQICSLLPDPLRQLTGLQFLSQARRQSQAIEEVDYDLPPH